MAKGRNKSIVRDRGPVVKGVMKKKGNKEDGSSPRLRSKSWVSSTGKKIILTGVNPLLLEKIAGGVTIPVRPQYAVETAFGTTEWHDHDESTLETPEERQAWNVYVKERDAADSTLVQRFTRVLFTKGISLEVDEEEMAEWEEEQKFFGIPIPEGKHERRMHYIETAVISNEQDIVEMFDVIMRLTGIDDEILDEARRSFQVGAEAVNQQ